MKLATEIKLKPIRFSPSQITNNDLNLFGCIWRVSAYVGSHHTIENVDVSSNTQTRSALFLIYSIYMHTLPMTYCGFVSHVKYPKSYRQGRTQQREQDSSSH